MGYLVTVLANLLMMLVAGLAEGSQEAERQVAGHLRRTIQKTVEVQYLL